MYSSLHLSQVIKYMIYLLLQKRSPLLKYVLPVTLDVSFLSAIKYYLQMSQELRGVVIFTLILIDLG